MEEVFYAYLSTAHLHREQLALKEQMIDHDELDFDAPMQKASSEAPSKSRALRFVGGVDISFVKGTADACASLVVLSFPDMKV